MPAVFSEKNTIWLVFDPPLREFFCTHAFAILTLATAAIDPFRADKRRSNAGSVAFVQPRGWKARATALRTTALPISKTRQKQKQKAKHQTPGLLASNGALCAEPATQGK